MESKLKSFCIAKEIIDKMKRKPTEWKMVSANYMIDKGLVSKTYKEQIIQFKKKNGLRD